VNLSDPLFATFLASARKHFPRWKDTPEELLVKLNNKISAIQQECNDGRVPDLSEEQAIALYSHLLNIRPKAALTNGIYWLVMDSMQKGIIDYDYKPNYDYQPIDEDEEKLDELRKSGGEKAVEEYKRLMKEYEKVADDPEATGRLIDSIGKSLFEETN